MICIFGCYYNIIPFAHTETFSLILDFSDQKWSKKKLLTADVELRYTIFHPKIGKDKLKNYFVVLID